MGRLDLLQFPGEFDTSESDALRDFFVPSLERAVRYDVGVGYFSSAWFRLAASGIAGLAENGGRSRWLISQHVGEEDLVALLEGDKARRDSTLRNLLVTPLAELKAGLEGQTRRTIAWMIADGLLDFRFVFLHGKLHGGDWHPKFGVIQDEEGNRIAFDGSYNLTRHANFNWESLNLFRSWIPGDASRVDAKDSRFERVWNGNDPNARVVELDEVSREELLEVSRTSDRPYHLADSAPITRSLPRDYQIQAIDAWFLNSNRGILRMATGTGKTKTALFAAARLAQERGSLLTLVLAPYKHLVTQWMSECSAFSKKLVPCSSDYPGWPEEISALRLSAAVESSFQPIVVATYDTFATERFSRAISQIPTSKLLIADEVHHLGSPNLRPDLGQFQSRLGLSATPERTYDPAGTAWLLKNVGPIVFRFDMKDAIPKFLCPYLYHITTVSLTSDEYAEYKDLLDQIAVACARQESLPDDPGEADSQLGALLRKRQELLGSAANKIPALRQVLDSSIASTGVRGLAHSLFYSSSGLFSEVMDLLSEEYQLKISRFTFEESKRERQEILSSFAAGRIDGVLAKKCLDEGMDVPATRTAFILASSSNPMEFIQRRGRVLRRFPGKEAAVIHDFFVRPPPDSQPDTYDRRLVERELKRSLEFASTAMNSVQVNTQLLAIKEYYQLLHL